MSATRRLPQITALLGAVTLSIAAIAKPAVRDRVVRALGVNVPGGTWRLLAIVFAVVNLKNWPFVWHVRPCRPPQKPVELYYLKFKILTSLHRIVPAVQISNLSPLHPTHNPSTIFPLPTPYHPKPHTYSRNRLQLPQVQQYLLHRP